MEIKTKNSTWIINKHINNYELLLTYLVVLNKNSKISDENLDVKIKKLTEQNIYTPRFGNINKTTFFNKITELSFYLMGFGVNNEKFILSQLSDLLLKHIDNKEYSEKILCSMLWGIQFPHPKNKTPSEFKIYPIRLLFKLMLDERLNFKIFTDEILFVLIFIEKIETNTDLEKIINDVLKFRNLSDKEKIDLFLNSHVGSQNNINKSGFEWSNEMFWANKTHEWQYYFLTLIQQTGIIKVNKGECLYKFKHFLPSAKTETYRSLNKNSYFLNKNLIDFVTKLDNEKPYNEEVLDRNEFSSDEEFTFSFYSFLPKILLKDINEESFEFKIFSNNSFIREDVNVELITKSSETSEMFNEFETILKLCFNLFDNVTAERISGPGKTDVECLYETVNEKFNVEAKTRKKQLTEVNTSRLKSHREINGSKMSLVITSRYSPGAINDIKNSNNLLLQSNVFSNYIYQVKKHDDYDFSNFYKIMKENRGTSISRVLYDFIIDNYSINQIN